MTIFCNCEGVLLVDPLPCDITINGPYYASLLHWLRSSIREKLRRGVLLLHDNAPVRKSNVTQAAIQYTGFIELNHPKYSSDIAPSDYHLFSNLKNFLRGRKFEADDEALMIVNHWRVCQNKWPSYYFSDISAMLHRIGLVFFSKCASGFPLSKCINSKVLNEFIGT